MTRFGRAVAADAIVRAPGEHLHTLARDALAVSILTGVLFGIVPAAFGTRDVQADSAPI